MEQVAGRTYSGWSGLVSEGGVITSNIDVGTNQDGRLEVFARGTDGALWHKWQVAPNSGWSGWASEGGIISPDDGLSAPMRNESFDRDNAEVSGTENAGANAIAEPHPLGSQIGLTGVPPLGIEGSTYDIAA